MKKVKLGEVCEILNGFAFKSLLYVNEGIRIIRITNVQKGYIEDSDPKYYPIEYRNSIEKYILKENDLLMSLTGNVGRVGLISKTMLPAALNQRVACLRTIDSLISKEYVFQFLNSDLFEQSAIRSSNGVAQKNLSTDWLKKVEITYPSVEQQKLITSTLNLIERLICCRKEQNKKLNELAKSRFNEMFGDPVLNEMGWEIETLNKIGTIGRGVSKHRPRNASELFGGIYPFIQTGDVANSGNYIVDYHSTYSEFGLKQSKLWDRGTLCITIAANIAKTSILAFDSCFPDSIVGFIPGERTNNMFIHYWFSYFQKILESQAPESAQKNINLKILSELKVILPPLSLQNEFA
ncbi:restriction endonuclease subunit S, partial [Streptococcus sp. HMSC067H01]|uniref:restriction endonuclease subunit S n=1 Tax=Streptococcus sp. HMSC067H01 TaxID=1739491 RepID=UPI001C58086F